MASRPAVRVTVAGATGLVGRALLTRLSGSPQVGPVTALVRQAGALGIPPARVQPRVVDYRTLGTGAALPATDWAFCALGTTIKVAGSQAAFRAVDVDAVLAFAQAARAAGATRFGLVSAMGADARSGVFYNRCKGEVEQALVRLDSAASRETQASASARHYDEVFAATEQRWKAGLGSQLELEETRRLAAAARSLSVDVRAAGVAAWIGLYRAVGGGWQPGSADTAERVDRDGKQTTSFGKSP